MSALDRKLLRDLWRMKVQGFAIALVIAAGVLLLVMMDGLVNSLEQSRRTYYEEYRLAEIHAPVKRAPLSVLERITELDGVAAAEARIIGGALVDLPEINVPVRAMALSLPETGPPRLNDVRLTAGARLDGRHKDDILLLESFAAAHGLRPGDLLTVTLNGRQRRLRIAGLAMSPEFLYSAAPGELVPDDARFAVLWMGRETLAAAYDLEGAFNEVLVGMEPGAELRDITGQIDRLLAPWGSTGAYGLKDQISNRFITEEISGLRASAATVPPVFLAVAAFLLNIVISRMIDTERTQIGLMKAFGYRSREISLYYLKLILVIAAGGAVLGCILGVWSGQALAGVYQYYYKFPYLDFRVDPAAFGIAIGTSVLAAAAGGLLVLRRVFALTAAAAMRPPAPPDYSASADLPRPLRRVLDQPSRMILRRLMRQPVRALAAMSGIAAGLGLAVSMLGVMGGFDKTLDLTFSVIDRSDATVTFLQPEAAGALRNLQHLDGVLEVEPFRTVPVILRNGTKFHRTALEGLTTEPRLKRAMTAEMTPVYIRQDGIVLSSVLAEKLAVQPGDFLSVEVREGRRPVLTLPVVQTAQSLLGAPAYLEMTALNRALGEEGRYSGAYLRLDADKAPAVYKALKDMPGVAGVSLKAEARDAFQRIMNEGAGSMRFIMGLIAGIITFGIVYNSARIAFSERAHELASLRVIGYTKGEAGFVLLGELGLITLGALPLGIVGGYGLVRAIAAGFSTDLYSVPAEIGPAAIGGGVLAVLIAALFSGWFVGRDVNRLDPVSALKARE